MNPKSAIAIAEWRGLPEEPWPKHSARLLADTLSPYLAELGLEERLREDAVLRAWRDVVGDFLAGQSKPARLKDGTLYVNVLQSTVHFELERVWKREILTKLKARFGEKTIREIRFRVG